MKKFALCYLLFFVCLLTSTVSAQKSYRYSVQKIWDNGTYNAFTSLLKYKNKFYCSFREGRGHIFDENGLAEGKVRILCSKNGKSWKSVALIGESGLDFRDPKLSIGPDGRMVVSIGVSVYRNKELVSQSPYVCFTGDGVNFTKARRCEVEEGEQHETDWIWRTTWQGPTGYAVNYFKQTDGQRGLWLMTTADGIRYRKLTELQVPDFPNESTVRFLPDGRMALMVRRDGGDCMGYWGLSQAPYTQWEWKKMPFRLGGPDFLIQGNNRVIVGSRCHHIESHCTTSLYAGNAETGRFEQCCVLPSGGDTSYTGLLVEGQELWVTYYAGHESHWPCIYLAKIPLSFFP